MVPPRHGIVSLGSGASGITILPLSLRPYCTDADMPWVHSLILFLSSPDLLMANAFFSCSARKGEKMTP